MAKGNNSGISIIILASFVGAVLILYFLSKILLILGVLLIITSIFLVIIGASQGNNLVLFGILLFLVGIIFAGIGHEGVTFFEQNPTGKNLLNTANTVVNTTKDAVESYSEIGKIQTQVLKNVTNGTT